MKHSREPQDRGQVLRKVKKAKEDEKKKKKDNKDNKKPQKSNESHGHQHAQQAKESMCFKCGESGHTVKTCPKGDIPTSEWIAFKSIKQVKGMTCLLYTSPSPRDLSTSRMPSSA